MKVLIAVDGSACSKRAIDYVAHHVNLFGKFATLTIVNVQIALPPHVSRNLAKSNVQTYYLDGYEKAMKPARQALKAVNLAYTEALKVGNPGDEITKLAKRGRFDMVVMGSHGRGLLRNLVLGSVATRVLATSTAPVLIIR
ncbi:MAG: universal stress protein [Burkholderiales bacterium]